MSLKEAPSEVSEGFSANLSTRLQSHRDQTEGLAVTLGS